jgi:hemerythrin superfamily protein
MDLYQLIKQDHRKIRRLFERLAEAHAHTPSRERLFAELKRELDRHAEVEETYFYPALRDHPEAKLLVAEALEEHGEMRDVLAALARADRETEGWSRDLSELQEDLEHHVEQEETKIFPLAERLIPEAEAEAIAGKIEKEKAAAQRADR